MKISLNWLKQYSDADLAPEGIDALVDRIGSQLGAVEEVEHLGERYQNVWVAKVVSCQDHPNADRLHVCKIDDGGRVQGVERDEQGLVQVVCGAPNVREGLLVAWLPPGATVPETVGKDPFVLEARPLRGEVSNGMLASARELALGDSHAGILEVDADVAPGTPLAEAYGLDDVIIDIENKMFTHRPDCFGQLGVAREIAGIYGQPFHSPDWYLHTLTDVVAQDGASLPLAVHNELPAEVPRFVAIALSEVHIKPSPMWMQTYLNRVGIRPINNVVDVTNYIMMLTGQPLHAYDYDKVKAFCGSNDVALTVRYPRKGEQIALLNGKTIEPRSQAMMVAAGDHLACVGGAMGGVDTEVSNETKNIILEAATWDMYSIRRTSMTHGIFTDAVTRFNKGQSPLQNDKVISKAIEMLRELAQVQVASPLIDDIHVDQTVRDRDSVHPPVTVAARFINERLGVQLGAPEMARLLSNVEFSVSVEGDDLTVAAPFWRTDIEIPEDVVEEVGRLYGFDHLPKDLPRRDLTPAPRDPELAQKTHIRMVLSAAGANELLTYSFVHGQLLDKVGQDKNLAFQISNAISPDLQYYRLSLLPSLLEKVHANIKAGFGEFALYEVNKVHGQNEFDEEGLPQEFMRIALVFAADTKAAQQYSGAAYYQVRVYFDRLLQAFGTEMQLQPLAGADLSSHAMLEQMCRPFEPGRTAVVHNGERIVGVMGEFRAEVCKRLKLPEFTAGFELFARALPTEAATTYQQLSRFPKVEQDICLKVPADMSYQEVFDCVDAQIAAQQTEDVVYQLSPLDIYQREDDAAHKQVTLRLTIGSYVKTMTDAEVARILDKVAEIAGHELQAERV